MDMPNASIVSQGDPTLDARSFRQCLGMFATGVTVITTRSGDQTVGVTVNSFSSLSLDPPLILWSISRSARSFPVFRDATHFAVNVLAASQIDVSQLFATPDADRFARSQWRPGADGVPLLEGVVAHLECSTEAQYDGGDHMIVVGRVQRFSQFAGAGLLFAQGRYGIAEDHPEVTRKRQAIVGEQGNVTQDSPTLRLLFQALHYMYDAFEQHRLAEGLTIAQVRVLRTLYENPGLGLEQLSELAYLGPRDAEDAVAELIESGSVVRVESGFELTPTGRARREVMRERIRQFEKAFLADMSESDLADGRRFLERIIAKRGDAAGSS